MNYTFTKETSYDLIAEGEYEVIAERVEEKLSKNGKKHISIMFRIRDDIEQPAGNRVLFESIWKERDTEFYNRKRLNQLLGTQHFEDGKTFKDIDDVIQNMIGAYLVAVVRIIHNDYTGEDENSISYYKSSNHLPKALGSRVEESNDEDLPF